MKKVLKGILLFMLMFCLVGCNKDATNDDADKDVKKETQEETKEDKKDESLTAEDVLKKVEKKYGDIKNYDCDMTMDYALSSGEETMDMSLDMSMQIEDTGLETVKMGMLMEMTSVAEGEESTMTMNTYYVDGYSYIDMSYPGIGEYKYKEAADASVIQESFNGNSLTSEIQLDVMKTLELTEDGDYYIIDFVCDESKMDEMLNSMMGTVMGELEVEIEYSVSGIEGTYKIDKDFNIVELEMDMIFDMTAEGETVSCDITCSMIYNAWGDDVTVDLPDLSEYEELE